MENKEQLNYQFQQACVLAKINNKSAYVFAWLFVKNLIIKGYNIEKVAYSTHDNENIYLIDNYIEEEDIQATSHNIRKMRNFYEHGDEEKIPDINYQAFITDLESIIKYINNNNTTKFQFINIVKEISIEKDVYNDFEVIPDLKIQSKYNYTIYNNGYVRQNSYFMVNKFVNEVRNPIFAIIHNILIRNTYIKTNEFLHVENLNSQEKADVFQYQIALLTLLSNFNDSATIKISSTAEEITKLALKNIFYYYNIISKMCRTQYNFEYEIKIEDNLSSNEIIVNTEKIEINNIIYETDTNLINNSHVLLSNKNIKYYIDNDNIEYYNMLLEELFDIPSFRDGQISALKNFFENKDSLMIILPTGYGKSLIYQFIGLIYPKVTCIVSPDEFLINDQISNLYDSNINRVSYLNDISLRQSNLIGMPFINIIFKSTLNYVTAEGILSEKIMETVKRLSDGNYLSAISIDECHKMSIWGHQFNSRYFTLIRQLVENINDCKFLLFSATVSTRVKNEIINKMKNIKILQPCPLKRHNIIYDIQYVNNMSGIAKYIEEKLEKNIENISEEPKLSIVVNNDKKLLYSLAEELKKNKKFENKCIIFDGSIEKYELFKLSNKSILFTTDKYLTGININFLDNLFVIGMPISKEWFYQQSGRVGRYQNDGFVSVILNNENNKIIDKILNNNTMSIEKNDYNGINHKNLTEIIEPYFKYDEKYIECMNKLVDEIKKIYLYLPMKIGEE